jgi:hypothetical protein
MEVVMRRSLLLPLLVLSLLFITGCGLEVEGDEPGECSDGVDNDQDGITDCADESCQAATVCVGDDDDAAGDDDDTAGDDDDSAGDDDDSVGDDDDTAGDDDDSAGDDDDDTTGDDDDTLAGPDEDGDGYAPISAGGTDCDDANPAINPSAIEQCDEVDNNCNGFVDDDPIDGLLWHLDSDTDGYGGQLLSEEACTAPAGYVDNTDDCNDLDGAVYPGATELCNGLDDDCDGELDDNAPAAQTWYLDNDGDGVGGLWLTQEACSMPQGYAGDSNDCDDTNAAVYPTAPELCDGNDNDCDGSLGSDEIDDDGDGVTECSQDCDDTNPLIFPGSVELCDGIDNDCNVSTVAGTGETDADGDQALACNDCDDDPVTGPAAYPGAAEICDGADNDCDGTVDIGATNETTWYFDADGDTYGGFLLTQQACTAPTGYVASSTDCAELDPNSYPGAAELCDGIDNDCNGTVDDGAGAAGTTWYGDSDTDTFGDPGTALVACSQPAGFVSNSLDCDDGDTATNPSSYEICDGSDNNCDGSVDESSALDAEDWYIDNDGDGYGVVGVSISACDQPAGYADNFADCDDNTTTGANHYPGNTETCDGVDEDCDSLVDEDFDQDSDGAFDENDAGCASTYAASVLDCDDFDEDTNPGGTEVCGDGDDQDCDGSDLICFNTVVFTNCSATGRSGPSQNDCNSAYAGTDLSGAVTVTGGIQQWVVPVTDVYRIEVMGAQGGSIGGAAGGLGAQMQGEFTFQAGTTLLLAVGQFGTGAGNGGGGGGGSYVVLDPGVSTSDILVVAGGGGGATSYSTSIAGGGPGLAGTSGGTSNITAGPGTGSAGGSNGGGGGSGYAAGGGGYSSDGDNDGGGHGASGGASFLTGCDGGASSNGNGHPLGGFGGGGAGSPANGYGGGGGGYSGGGGGGWNGNQAGYGGGGGSFNIGVNQVNVTGVRSSHGQVTISLAN